MKKVVPFSKKIDFSTNIAEITSISLEHNLKVNKNNIEGEFIVSGSYKVTETSLTTQDFSHNIDFDVTYDEKYNLKNVVVDIDDFYYEIIDSRSLMVNIDLLVDKIEEILIEKNIIEEVRTVEIDNLILENDIEEILKEAKPIEIIKDVSEKCSNLFDNLTYTDTYTTYKVYIVREGDDLNSILEKYSVTKEMIIPYNDLTEIKLGDKLIIPSNEKI
ncbi:MAG: LysM domain-containing protein [Mycoplasmatota bacterium]